MRRLSKKEALVMTNYKNNAEIAMCHILGKPIEVDKLEYNDTKVSKKEVSEILNNLIVEGLLYKDETILSLLKKNGALIRLIENQTEEEQMTAVMNSRSSYSYIKDMHKSVKEYLLLHDNMCSKEEWLEGYSDDEIIYLMKENIDIATVIPENRWTQNLVTEFLRKVVTMNIPLLMDDYQRRVKIPEQFRDKTFYLSYCMVNGYNYSKIPKDKKEEYITEKLVNYTLEHDNTYVGVSWMYQNIPEKLKTKEISLKCCIRHFACFSYLPKLLQTREFIADCIAMGQKQIPISLMHVMDEEQILEIVEKGGGYCCPEIPKSLITNKIANAMARFITAPQIVPKAYRTREWYLTYVGFNGHLEEVPNEYIDEEMCIAAMRGNYLAAAKHVPEKYKTDNYKKIVTAEHLFDRIKNAELTMDEVSLNEYVYKRPYTLSEVPDNMKSLVRDETLVKIIKNNGRFWDNVLKFRESEAVVEALLEESKPGKNSEIRNRFYVASKLTHVPEDVIEEFIPNEERAINLKGITRAQIEKSLEYFPENVLYIPEQEEEEISQIIKQEGLNPTVSSFAGIPEVSQFTQMTIWDILTA